MCVVGCLFSTHLHYKTIMHIGEMEPLHAYYPPVISEHDTNILGTVFRNSQVNNSQTKNNCMHGIKQEKMTDNGIRAYNMQLAEFVFVFFSLNLSSVFMG